MLSAAGTWGERRGSLDRQSKVITALALAGAFLLFVGLTPAAGHEAGGEDTPVNPGTGFTQPFAGTPRYEHVAPTEITNQGQLHQAIGQGAADQIARQLGLSKEDAFTEQQYEEFITGGGVPGSGKPDQAKIVDASVRIFTNTVGRPLVSNVNGQITPTVLASYGLFVNENGLLESLANMDAPTRAANSIIAPGGYFGTWCAANGAERSLIALYRSAFPAEAAFGLASQNMSDPWQLVTNSKRDGVTEVGMSMAPSIWIVNFALLYILNPAVAAEMPASWAPIPSTVADAILHSPSGQVPYSEFASDLP